MIVKRFEMLVDILKTKMIKDVLMFQNEEQLKEKGIRQEVDSDFFGFVCRRIR